MHEVHAKKNIRHRGQAYVVMKSQTEAEQAIKTLRGYPFFGKPMRLNFSKKESDLIAKINGTFDEAVLKKRAARHEQDTRAREIKLKRKMIDRLIKLRRQTAQMHNEELEPRFRGANTYQSGVYKILFIERLPKLLKQEVLEEIFTMHHGFVEVRHVPEKGVAFVEFINDDCATNALHYV